jgi:hypothetical protein
MVDHFLLRYLDLTYAGLPDYYHALCALAWGAALIAMCAIPLAFTTALRKRRLALAGIMAWQLLLLATMALAPEPLLAPIIALPFFLLRGCITLKLKGREALALAVYLSLVSLAAACATWFNFGLLLAY